MIPIVILLLGASLPAQLARVDVIGEGCGLMAGDWVFSTQGRPVLGGHVDFWHYQPNLEEGIVWWVAGLENPLGARFNGCEMYVVPLAFVPFTEDTVLRMEVPNDPSLVGMTVWTQLWFNSSTRRGDLSHGIRLVIGDRSP